MHAFFEKHSQPYFGALIEFALLLLDIVFAGQLCSFLSCDQGVWKRSFWVQTQGITTGLSCAVEIANACLLGLDAIAGSALASSLKLYARYIDDVLMIFDHAHIEYVIPALNLFDDGINVTYDYNDCLRATTYLDLFIEVRDKEFHHRLFRKPLCAYAYVPWSSSHPFATKCGIVRTELVRLLRTCKYASDFNREVCFFQGKLKDRGYPPKLVRHIVSQYPFDAKARILEKRCTNIKHVVPLKLEYCDGFDRLHVSAVLVKHKHLLPQDFSDHLRAV